MSRPLALASAALVASFASAACIAAAPAHAQPVDSTVVARAGRALCDRRVVLLGELPSHGESRGFEAKARLVDWLLDRCGFDAVLFEAAVYDFVGLEDAIARRTATQAPLDSAIGRFWWTRELAPWRAALLRRAMEGRLVIGGIDDQPSITSVHARAVLPGLVAATSPPGRGAECEQVVARHLFWRYDAAQPFDAAEHARLQRCTRDAADAAAARTRRAKDRRGAVRDSLFLANLASVAERQRGAKGARERDHVMYDNLRWYAAQLPAGAKIVVWTASVHAARQEAGTLGEMPLGARAAARWGRRLGTVGFTALGGRSATAGQPARTMPALPAGSLEERALKDGATWAWLDARALRALGPVRSRILGDTTAAEWSRWFDGVVVVREEAAPVFEFQR